MTQFLDLDLEFSVMSLIMNSYLFMEDSEHSKGLGSKIHRG